MDKRSKDTVTTDQEVIDCQNLVTRLLKVSDYTKDECQSDLATLRSSTAYENGFRARVKVTEAYSDAGLARLFQKIWGQIFPMKLDYEKPECQNAWNSLDNIMFAMWRGSDCSPKLCKSIMDTGVYKYIFEVAKEIPNNKNITNIEGLGSIIHNVLYRVDEAKKAFCEQGANDLMETWRASDNIIVQTLAEITLAYLINGDESDKIDSVGQTLKYLLKLLDGALKSSNHVSPTDSYRAEEIIKALNKLAANDKNKENIVKLGALPHYTRMMQKDFNQSEQYLAVKGLWNLSFIDINKEIIKADSACMQSLKNLASSSKYRNVRNQAQGALLLLEEINNDNQKALAPKAEKKDKSEACKDDSYTPHIMISYNWEHQTTMVRVRDRLKAAGYKVWMDVDDMKGSTLDAMADAVENACLVLVCFSKRYKDSVNCRMEGHYTQKLQKEFIPLRLQYKYDPDGWLGMFVGTALWYNFSVQDKFEASITALIKRIGNRGKIGAAQPLAPKPIVPTHEDTTDASPPTKKRKVFSVPVLWKKKEIEEWLKKNELEQYSSKFANYDGSMLLELRDMWKIAPDFFYASLKGDFGFELTDILKFTQALKKL